MADTPAHRCTTMAPGTTGRMRWITTPGRGSGFPPSGLGFRGFGGVGIYGFRFRGLGIRVKGLGFRA